VATLSVSAAALLALLRYERRREEPLIDLRFFRSIPFASAVALAIAAFASFGGFLFLNTLYLQQARGLSPVEAGLATAPMAVMIALMSPLSGRLVGRRGPRLPLVVAGACILVACSMLTGIRPATPFSQLVIAYVVFGLGFGLVNAPITNSAVSGMPRAQAGVAAAVASTSRQVGTTLGVAVVGAIATSQVGRSASADLSAASHPAWWVLAACGGVVLALGWAATGGRARASAQRTAAELNPEALAA
jgi:MFS family permease